LTLILLVENDQDSRDNLAAVLRSAGYQVATAANGRDAHDCLMRSGVLPGVILLDLAMPVMDGWHFREKQVRDPQLARIPVVVLSGETDLHRIATGLGAAAYLPKPTDPIRLLNTLQQTVAVSTPRSSNAASSNPAQWPDVCNARPMRKYEHILIHGALAGALGAACMTALRMAAHRAGWLDVMVPQAVEVWASEKSHLGRPRDTATHHVADQLLHLGYGAVAGTVYAGLAGKRRQASSTRALGFGAALWAFGSAVLLPALHIARPLWRASPGEELVNFAAHALYGGVTVYLLDEFERQRTTQPKTWQGVQHARVG
jgi:CheY-like chemotaxis protein